MAGIDIFNLQKTVITKDLSGKYLLLYSKPKVGKTSFAAQIDKNLILATELGTNAIDNLSVVPILKWADVKQVLKQLRDPKARELYNTVTFDTISIASDLVEKYICSREGVDSIRDIPFGQGFKMVAKELQETLREITLLGFGLILICHSKEKPSSFTDEEGNTIPCVEPDLSKNVYSVCNSLVDGIFHIGVEFDKDGKSHRYLYTRQTPTIFAGSRWKYLAPKIEFGYQQLIDAIGEAIEKQKEVDGAVVVDHQEREAITKRPFTEVMDEAKAIWVQYLEGAATDEEKDYRLNVLNEIILKNFGRQIKLSQALPSQQDLVELVLDDFKALQ
jgi:hypothetical protein